MSVSIDAFWKLAVQSKLMTKDQAEILGQEYGGIKGAAQQGNARSLAEWLIAKKELTRYQTTLLQANCPGPFYYGEYIVYDRIDKGSREGWFRAVHNQTGHPVQLQFASGPALENPSLWASMAERANAFCSIDHPQLSRCYEVVDLGSHKFIVHEDLPGQPLSKKIATSSALAPQEAARYIRLAALGLAHLHSLGADPLHLDPSLLWLEPGGNLKLLLDPLLAPTPIGEWTPDEGTRRLDYAAPELGKSSNLPNALTDVYALGCIFYQLLSGQAPFEGGDSAHKLTRHAAEPVQPLEQWGVSQPMAQIANSLMAKKPSARLQDMDVVAEQLAGFVEPSQLNRSPNQPLASLKPYLQSVQKRQKAQPAEPSSHNISAPLFNTNTENPAIAGTTTLQANSAPPSFSVTPDSDSSMSAKLNASQKGWLNTQNSLMAGGILIVVLVVGALIIRSSSRPPTEGQPLAATEANDAERGASPSTFDPEFFEPQVYERPSQNGDDTEDILVRHEIVEDDGELLWASPTVGKPIDLSLVPPGAQLFMVVRPQAMLASTSGKMVMEALGPDVAAARKAWEESSGINLEEIDQLIIAFFPKIGQPPQALFVVRFKEPRPNLLASWSGAQVNSEGQQQFYTRGKWSFYLDPDQRNQAFVMGPTEEIRLVAELRGAPPTLRREIAELLEYTDRNQHFNLLVAPSFLQSDGRKLFENSYREQLLDPIRWFLGDDMKGAMASMYFGDAQFYAEARFIGTDDVSPLDRVDYFEDRMAEIPRQIERSISQKNLAPHARLMLSRFPQMLFWVKQHARYGTEGKQVILNCSGEPRIAHNLVMASELALVASSSGSASIPLPAQPIPQNHEEAITTKASMAFSQTSLEFAMRDLADITSSNLQNLPFEFKIKILGNDLQLEGITRNQQIVNFDESDKTVAEILTSLVMKANPVTTVQSPSEVDQKLIWVIGPDPDNPSTNIVLITTRASAATKGYTLPALFQPSS